MAWRTANALRRLREQINAMAPQRSKASDGTIGDAAHASRESDHNPWVKDGDMGVVTAIDITDDPAGGCSAKDIVAALIASQDLRIKYIIWNKQITSATNHPWTPRPYNGKNPHIKHFHLSVKSDPLQYDSVSSWQIK
jgi:hypothetical protein